MSATRTYGGRYAVIERVGVGGMAEVYRARDELLGRDVALKVLSERLSKDRSFVERFRREAQSAANLNHPNIVSLYDYGSDEGSYFIVMEFIEGRSLADIIRDEGPLMPERAAEIASDVSKALGRAHSAGIVHRDIKPGNIMITSTGQTKVTDFGIARAVGGDSDATMTQTGMVIGTASYLSPEQAQGEPVDARSDVYSVGIVLYESLAGRPPFAGETPLSIAYKHVREEPPPLTSPQGEVPAELNAIVMKCLAKNAANRYADAGELHEDLQRYIAGQTVMATPLMSETMAIPRSSSTEVLSSTEVYEEEPTESKTWAYVLGTLLVIGLVGLLAWLFASNLFGGEPVDVPRVIGLTEQEARDRLEEANLEVAVEDAPSQKEEGTVFRQDPRQGTEVDEGDTVTIFVSSGPEEVEMPDLIGDPLEEAKDQLRELGLKWDVTREPSDEFDEGQVTDQSFPEGATVDTGETIDLTVASGPEPISVPNVMGFTEENAIATLEEAGLGAEVVRSPSEEDEGIVIAQEPTGGSDAEEGDVVTIEVSEGPEDQEMPDVRGQDADDAEAQLEEELGLNVTQTDETEACAQPPGTVCRQDPEPGASVSEGDDATLYVQPGNAFFEPEPFLALVVSLLFVA
ncbi:MAG TPA: Stk1 family PASTA domain-containing Ser/Thr kinase [Actinomycetota bacterium]|nr:Stk1 family PASTA domain-containing Ser/Thr kinase [Actinomycetota bacterium]